MVVTRLSLHCNSWQKRREVCRALGEAAFMCAALASTLLQSPGESGLGECKF